MRSIKYQENIGKSMSWLKFYKKKWVFPHKNVFKHIGGYQHKSSNKKF